VYGGPGEAPYAPSGWMGNQAAIKMDVNCTEKPHSGTTCLKVRYTAPGDWGGVVWQDPANDWGDKPGGWDLTGANWLFLIRLLCTGQGAGRETRRAL